MRICIPTLDDRGRESTPSDHFGSAPFFTFFDTETEDYESLPNQGADHVHGSCHPLRHLGEGDVDAVICRGLGRRAFAKLSEQGVEVFVTLERNAGDSVKALADGRLRLLTSDQACHGHSHGHSHGHGGGGWGGGGRGGCR